jgi:hypothetical protein
LQGHFHPIILAYIIHFQTRVFAGDGETYYRYRQISSSFFAAIDSILAGSGKILPTASKEFRWLAPSLFLILNIYPELSTPAEREPVDAGEAGVGNSNPKRTSASPLNSPLVFAAYVCMLP